MGGLQGLRVVERCSWSLRLHSRKALMLWDVCNVGKGKGVSSKGGRVHKVSIKVVCDVVVGNATMGLTGIKFRNKPPRRHVAIFLKQRDKTQTLDPVGHTLERLKCTVKVIG